MTIEIIERDSQSWPMWAVQRSLKLLGPDIIISAPKYIQGHTDVDGSPELTLPRFGMQGCTITPRVLDNINIYEIAPGSNAQVSSTAPKKKIYFLAGGAFKAQASALHWCFCAELANKIPNTTVSIISYPLAPKNSAPTAYPLLQKLLQKLLAESKDKKEIAIYVGDSAGGNLVLGLPLASIKEDSNALAPSAILAISPSVDFNHANPKSLEIEVHDPILSNAYCHAATAGWAASWDNNDPRLSPIKADLSVYAKRGIQVHGVVGKYDVLAPDAEVFVRKCQSAGVAGKWLLWDRQMHCFPLAFQFGLPEGISAVRWIVQTLTAV